MNSKEFNSNICYILTEFIHNFFKKEFYTPEYVNENLSEKYLNKISDNLCDGNYNWVFVCSIQQCDTILTNILIDHPQVNINCQYQPLYHAIENFDIVLIKELISRGAIIEKDMLDIPNDYYKSSLIGKKGKPYCKKIIQEIVSLLKTYYKLQS